MKLLTLNFLTCATKPCRAAATQTSTITPTPQPTPSDTDQQPSNAPSFPLHLSEVELLATDLDFNPLFWRNVLPRIDLPAMLQVVSEAGLKLPDEITQLIPTPPSAPLNDPDGGGERMEGLETTTASATQHFTPNVSADPTLDKLSDATLHQLHKLLLETQVQEGWLVCGRCGHRYAVKEGIPNFLLPPHLVG